MTPRPLETLIAGPDGAFPSVTALVGAGGKTTLMYALAERMAAAGRRVVCTTTTKIFPPQKALPLILTDGRDGEALKEALERAAIVVVARRFLPDRGKVEGIAPEGLAALADSLPGVCWLVEADGAARKPLKAPAPHEPVLPVRPECCVAVLGLDAVGRPLDEAHVHRAARACALAGQEPGSAVTPETLARLVRHPEGLFRTCPPSCRRLVFANKGDLPGAIQAARAAARLAGGEWAVGSAAQGWCLPLGILPFPDLP